MKHRRQIAPALLLLVSVFMAAGTAPAQEQQPDTPPKPAAKTYAPLPSDDDQDSGQARTALQPDDRPLTGFQDLTTGTPPELHSYWVPGLTYTNFVQSNALAQGGGGGWTDTSYIAGNLSLSQNWTTAQLSVNYTGGGSISTDSTIGSGQFHQLAAYQTFHWRRTQLTFLDQFSYLPTTQFGFGAGTSLAIPGVGGSLAPTLPGLQNGFGPSQSIFTQAGPVYSNGAGTQVTYSLSPRGSITLGGVFSILRFSESEESASNDVVLNAGYNYLLSKSDTLGVSYRFSAYQYIGQDQAIGDHAIQIMYGKKITGRLALRLGGGPEITTLRVPEGIGTTTEYIAPTGFANLTYAFAAGSVSLGYSHGVNNGSGVFLGATSDQITGSGNRRLTRVWSGNVSFGYVRNGSISGVNEAQAQAYNTLYVSAGLQRPLSRTANFTLSYNANIQTSNSAVCAGPNCGTDFTTHQINVGVSWHARPIVLH